MIYEIKWCEKKNNDWVVVSLIEKATSGDGAPNEYKEVSVNRVNKKNETFPNFDAIQAGRDVEGELWTSSAGKHYLFTPRVSKTANSGAFKQKMIDDTMTRKEGSIAKFQDSKEESIRLASAQRDSVLIVTQLCKERFEAYDDYESEVKAEIIKWRNWFLSDDFKAPPF